MFYANGETSHEIMIVSQGYDDDEVHGDSEEDANSVEKHYRSPPPPARPSWERGDNSRLNEA